MARKDPLNRLSVRQDVAVRQFLDAADELDDVAVQLRIIASAEDHAAAVAQERSAEARLTADQATKRASRIRELLG